MPIAIVALAVALSGCAQLRAHLNPPRPPSPPPANSSAESQVINSVNGMRAAHHMSHLAVNGDLENKARYWARWMAGGNCGRVNGVATICHSNLAGGIHVSWVWLAENVGAASPSTNIQGVIQGFFHSAPHLSNILSPRAKYIGVGVAYAGNMVYVAEEFMQT